MVRGCDFSLPSNEVVMLLRLRVVLTLTGLAALTIPAARADDKEPLPIEVIRTLKGPKGLVCNVTLSPDGKRLAAGGRLDNTVYIWDVETGEEKARLKLDNKTYTMLLGFSANGKSLSWDDGSSGVVRTYDVESGKVLKQFTYQSRGKSNHHAYGTAFSSDAKLFAYGASFGGQSVELWDVETGKLVRELPLPSPNSVAFSADGKMLAGQDSFGRIRIWDEKGKQLHEVQRPVKQKMQVAATMLAFSPDGKYLAAAGQVDMAITVWEAQSGKKVQSLTLPGTEEVSGLVFSADGKWIGGSFLQGRTETLHFWELATGKKGGSVNEDRPLGFTERSMIFSPSGAFFTAGGVDQVRLYGAKKGHEKDVPFFAPAPSMDVKPKD
jgi:WD40 repeat protein